MNSELVKTIPEALRFYGPLSETEIIQKLRLRNITKYSIRELDESITYLIAQKQIRDAVVLNATELYYKIG
jgi:hypothetical protein